MKIEIEQEEYEQLLEDSQWLNCLEMAGVDNWEGFEHAQEFLNEE